jgi:GT2 family glycosyltransferase
MQRPTLPVGVVLIHWNSGLDVSGACIASLYKGTVVPQWVVVVDNASREDPFVQLKAEFPAIHGIRNAENIGFTGGNNVGIRWLIAQGAEAIWVLNNDTVVAEDCLEHLMDALANIVGIGIATGKIYYFDKKNVFWDAGTVWNYRTLAGGHRGMGEVDTGQFTCLEDIPFADGCCMLIRTQALLDAGLFDERFFAYNEDKDLSFRIAAKGYRILFQPAARLWHRVSHSMSKNASLRDGCRTSPFQQYLSIRNRLYLIRRYAHGGFQRMLLKAWFVGRLLFIYVPTLICLGRFGKVNAVLTALKTGLSTDLRNVESAPGRHYEQDTGP